VSLTSSDHEVLKREILAFARAELEPGAAERDKDQVFSRELWKKCGEHRLPGLVAPEEFGGRGLDPVSAVIALEGLGAGSSDGGLSFALCAHLLACVVPIWKHGSDELKRAWLPGLSDGTLVAANAMTEPDSGSDAFSTRTHAVAEGDEFRINGRKTFVSNGPVADLIVTYAATAGGEGKPDTLTAFAIPATTRGLSRGALMEKIALRTCLMSEVVFDNVIVPATSVIGRVGAGGQIFAQSMEWERACLVALHVGAMERILAESVEYARTRKSQGTPIGKFQAVSHKLADMKVRLEAARLLTRQAAEALNTRHGGGLSASIAKLFASEALLVSATDAVRTLGGSGVLAGGHAERALRDAVASTLYSGTNDIQRNIIARWLGL
jgi:alkylation response protein AidB-like acyl-CoA dehydrogenase